MDGGGGDGDLELTMIGEGWKENGEIFYFFEFFEFFEFFFV